MKSLEEILEGNGNTVDTPSADSGNAPESTEYVDPPPATGDIAGTPPEEDTDGHTQMVPITALLDERRKRREMEERLARVETDEPAFNAGGIHPGELEEALSHHMEAGRMDQAENAARSRFPDFDQKLDAFAQLADIHPGLSAQLAAAPDPGEFAYRVGAQALAMMGSHQSHDQEARIRADEREKVRREMLKERLPESLSSTQSAGSAKDNAAWRPKSIEEILKGKGING